MANITELIKNIRNAILGKEVRESIASAIEQCYEDASKNGNSYMEVTEARGIYNTLKKRLDNSDIVKANKENLEIEIESRKSKDNNLQTQINSLASGSPLVAGSVSEMTDINRVYVNTSDGHWYTYNGNSWVDGGIYQATIIQDNSIDMLKLEDSVSRNFEKDFTDLNLGEALSGFIKVVSNKIVTVSSESYNYYVIDLDNHIDDIIQVIGYNIKPMLGFVIADEEDNVIYSSDSLTEDNSYITFSDMFKINKNKLKLYISYSLTDNFINNNVYVRKLTSTNLIISPENLKYSQTVENIKKIENCFIRTTSSLNALPVVAQNYDSSDIYIYEMKKGIKYKINFADIYEICGLTLLNLNNEVIYMSSSNNLETAIQKTYEFTARENGFIAVSALKTQTYSVNRFVVNSFKKDNIYDLSNKKIGFVGDSICVGNSNQGGYSKIINELTNCKISKKAISGSTIAESTQDVTQFICNFVDDLEADINMLIFEGGVNDYYKAVPLGSLSTGYPSSFDKDTFYGALEYLFTAALNKYNNVSLVYLNIHKVKEIEYTQNSIGLTFADYRDAIKRTAEKYGIALINIDETGMNTHFPNISSLNTIDGLHPNEAGYKDFYVPAILSKIYSLLII